MAKLFVVSYYYNEGALEGLAGLEVVCLTEELAREFIETICCDDCEYDIDEIIYIDSEEALKNLKEGA